MSENLVPLSAEGIKCHEASLASYPTACPFAWRKLESELQPEGALPLPTPPPSLPVLSHVIRNAYNEPPHPVGKVWCSWFYSFSVAFGILKDMFVLKKPILAGSVAGFGEVIDFSEPLTELGVRCFDRGDLEEDLRGKQ